MAGYVACLQRFDSQFDSVRRIFCTRITLANSFDPDGMPES